MLEDNLVIKVHLAQLELMALLVRKEIQARLEQLDSLVPLVLLDQLVQEVMLEALEMLDQGDRLDRMDNQVHRVHEVILAAQDLLEIMVRLALLVMLGHLGLLAHEVVLAKLEMQVCIFFSYCTCVVLVFLAKISDAFRSV